MELTYHWEGDYLIPDLTIGEEKEPIGKYGMLRKIPVLFPLFLTVNQFL